MYEIILIICQMNLQKILSAVYLQKTVAQNVKYMWQMLRLAGDNTLLQKRWLQSLSVVLYVYWELAEL